MVIKIQSRLKLGILGSSQESFLFAAFERGNHLSVFTLQRCNQRKRMQGLQNSFVFSCTVSAMDVKRKELITYEYNQITENPESIFRTSNIKIMFIILKCLLF